LVLKDTVAGELHQMLLAIQIVHSELVVLQAHQFPDIELEVGVIRITTQIAIEQGDHRVGSRPRGVLILLGQIGQML